MISVYAGKNIVHQQLQLLHLLRHVLIWRCWFSNPASVFAWVLRKSKRIYKTKPKSWNRDTGNETYSADLSPPIQSFRLRVNCLILSSNSETANVDKIWRVHVPSKFQHSRQALVKKALCKWLGWNGLVEIETELTKKSKLIYIYSQSIGNVISSSPMSKPMLLVHLQWLFCWESVPFCQPRRSFHFAPPAPRRTRHPHQQLQKHQAPPRHLRWKTKAPPPLVQRKHSWCLLVLVARMKRRSHNLSFKQLQVTKISIMHTYGY